MKKNPLQILIPKRILTMIARESKMERKEESHITISFEYNGKIYSRHWDFKQTSRSIFVLFEEVVYISVKLLREIRKDIMRDENNGR